MLTLDGGCYPRRTPQLLRCVTLGVDDPLSVPRHHTPQRKKEASEGWG